MLLDRIYRKVKTYINTEGRGNLKPDKFNSLAHDAIQQRFEELLYEVNRLINRENRGLSSNLIDNLPNKISEKIAHYLQPANITSTTAHTYPLPEEYNFIDEVESKENGVSFDYCKSKREFNILKTQATNTYPVYVIVGPNILTSNDLGELTVHHLRKPKKPKWTYTLFDNNELFNSSIADFEDADIHPSEENEIVRKVLLASGVNLKEQDVVSFAMQEETNDFNEQNAT